MHIHLCIVQDCFYAVTAELNSHNSDLVAHKDDNVYYLFQGRKLCFLSFILAPLTGDLWRHGVKT